jgi:hypothetical protein
MTHNLGAGTFGKHHELIGMSLEIRVAQINTDN